MYGLEGTEFEPSDEEIFEAARLANASAFIDVRQMCPEKSDVQSIHYENRPLTLLCLDLVHHRNFLSLMIPKSENVEFSSRVDRSNVLRLQGKPTKIQK